MQYTGVMIPSKRGSLFRSQMGLYSILEGILGVLSTFPNNLLMSIYSFVEGPNSKRRTKEEKNTTTRSKKIYYLEITQALQSVVLTLFDENQMSRHHQSVQMEPKV